VNSLLKGNKNDFLKYTEWIAATINKKKTIIKRKFRKIFLNV